MPFFFGLLFLITLRVAPSFRHKYKYEIWTHKYKWQNRKLEVAEVWGVAHWLAS